MTYLSMDDKIIASQSQIVINLQEKLLDAIARGDWSATENWCKFLNISAETSNYFNQENFMNLKEKIAIIEKAIADRDSMITNLKEENKKLQSDDSADKSEIAALTEGDKAADELITKLSSPS